VPHGLAGADLPQNEVFLALPNFGDDDPNRLPDRLRSRVTEHALGRGIPRQDDPVQILADDGVIRRIDDLCEMSWREIVGRVPSVSSGEGKAWPVARGPSADLGTDGDRREASGRFVHRDDVNMLRAHGLEVRSSINFFVEIANRIPAEQ
jgi:hypothetical protein